MRRTLAAGVLCAALVGVPALSAEAAPARVERVSTADAKITFGWALLYLNLWGHEVKALGRAGVVVGGTSAVAACGSKLKKLPATVGKVVQVVCKILGAPTAYTVMEMLKAVNASGIRDGLCYQYRLPRLILNLKIAHDTAEVVPAARNCF